MTDRFKMVGEVHLFLVRPALEAPGGEVLMIRRFNTGFADGLYSVPAGHMDGGEEVREAAIREAREEVGVTIARADLHPIGVMHRHSNNERVSFFFAAERWTGEVRNCEPHKCDEIGWRRFDALPANTVPYVRRALGNYLQGIWFDTHGWEGAPS